MASLSLYVISVFLPWLIEVSFISYRVRNVSTFWSFQVVMNNKRVNPIVLRFQEYWFISSLYTSPEGVFQGWLFIFAFQILGIIAGAINIVKEKVKGKPLPMICTITCSILSLVLCCFQLLRQLAPGRGYLWLSASFDIGFRLAVISVVLWLASLLICRLRYRGIKRRIMFLIATAIPTVLFMVFLGNFLIFYIKMRGAKLWVDWNVNVIGLESRGAGTGVDIWFFALALICTPLFVASILLLYKEWQTKKKQKAEKPMT